jgi:hypothetical protein
MTFSESWYNAPRHKFDKVEPSSQVLGIGAFQAPVSAGQMECAMPAETSLLSGLYFAPPSKPAALYAHRLPAFSGLRCYLQGIGSAIVAYSGATATVAPGAAPAAADFASVDALTLAMLEGRLTGPAQILAAIALFLTAGHSTARMMGMLTGMALVGLHMQGVTLRDALFFASEELRRLSELAQSSRSAASAI